MVCLLSLLFWVLGFGVYWCFWVLSYLVVCGLFGLCSLLVLDLHCTVV